MLLRSLLEDTPKADLQTYYLFWLPGNAMISERDKLMAGLVNTMSDQERVRDRFDGLGKSHQAFLTSLLGRDGYSGTIEDIRGAGQGRHIEDFEVESVIKTLCDGGFVHKHVSMNGSGRQEFFVIPDELGNALRRTVAIEIRESGDMLSRERALGVAVHPTASPAAGFDARLESIDDEDLRNAVREAVSAHHGILPHSAASCTQNRNPSRRDGGVTLYPSGWRGELEVAGIGTIGVLDLKDYGIHFEEESLVVFQENVLESASQAARSFSAENDTEVHVGTDLVVDIERFLELLRTERIEVTREGRIYKKTEDRISQALTTTRYGDVFEGSAVRVLMETCKRLKFFTIEDNRVSRDTIRRRAWKQKTLLEKYRVLFDLFLDDHQEKHWSFHQGRLRQVFLDHLRELEPGSWVGAHDVLGTVVAAYLIQLDDAGVREDYQKRCEEDFHDDALMIPLGRLQQDLSYWVVHRLVLLGFLDVGYRDGVLQSFRLSELGMRFFGLTEWREESHLERPALVNPDFEILVFPGMPLEDEANLSFSRFADRVESDRVKRYRLTRDSVKRGIVSGLSAGEIVDDLKRYSRADLPPNVDYTLREWTQGVQFVRCRKVSLLTSATKEGTDRLVEVLDESDIAHERLNDTCTAVRGSKNEKALRDLRESLKRLGLYME